MTLKQICQLVLTGVSITILAACSTTNTKAPVDSADGDIAAAEAKASGLGNESGFGDSDSKFGSADGASASGHKGSSMQVGDQTYYFDFDKSEVRSDDRPSVGVQANYLIKHPNAKVLLEGNTDPRGSREYNVALGQRRADAVADVLKSDGVNPDQIRTVSYGEEKLASQGHTDADYALDRRVNLVYVEK